MSLSKQLPQNAVARDFVNMQRYQMHQPSILNMYYGINLIKVIDKIPPLSKTPFQATQINLIENRVEDVTFEGIQSQLQNKILSYNHQVDRLGQDTQINQYTMTSQLGRGAHSTVRLAKDKGQSFAIKILWLEKIRKKYFIKQKQLVRLINSQVNLLKKLKHKNIVQFYQAIYSVQKQRMFIVLEYCSKGSLLSIVNKNLTTDEVIWFEVIKYYFREIVCGIKFMHQNFVIHRDIKPQNILVNEQNTVKIIDLNTSQVIPPSGLIVVTNKFIGTKGYAAPQLILNTGKDKQVDGRSIDIWALGISLLEMLEKKHPIYAKNLQQLHKCLSKQVKINQQFTPALRDLLTKMLKLENKQRITIQQIEKHQWLN